MEIKGQDAAESSPHSTFYKSKPQYSQGSGNSPSLIMVCAFFSSEFPWDLSQAILILWIHVSSSGDAPAGCMMPNGCFQFLFHSCPASRVDLAFCWFFKLCWKLSRWIWILNFLQKMCQVLVPLFLIFLLTSSHGFDHVPFKGATLTGFLSLCFRCLWKLNSLQLTPHLFNYLAFLVYVTICTHIVTEIIVSHVKMLKYNSQLWLLRNRRIKQSHLSGVLLKLTIKIQWHY